MIREFTLAAVAFVASIGVTLLAYYFLLWHYLRGYNEVVNMIVAPVIVALVFLNLVAAGVAWARHRFLGRHGLSPVVAIFLVAAALNALSPLFAPSIGRFANRNLWIRTPLIEAARYGDAPTVIALVENGTDPNEHSQSGDTALHHMAYQGQIEAVEVLLTKGADPNSREKVSMETPLHWAVRARTNLATIRMLIAHGASISAVDQQGRTPVDYTETIPEPQASDIRMAMQ